MIWFMDSELCDYCGEELDLSPVATICQRCYEAKVNRIFAEDPDLYEFLTSYEDTELPDGLYITEEISTMRPDLPRAFDILENAKKTQTERET